jgi:hypothetical protein
MGRAAVVLLGCALTFLVGCSGSAPAPPRPAPSGAGVSCSWYTPTLVNGNPDGQQVIVKVTGAGCHGSALISWIADKSGKPWATTHLVSGTVIAQIAKGGTIVRILQTGFALPTDKTAGYLADDFQAAGWAVQVPS